MSNLSTTTSPAPSTARPMMGRRRARRLILGTRTPTRWHLWTEFQQLFGARHMYPAAQVKAFRKAAR